jgi:hypothetical protein
MMNPLQIQQLTKEIIEIFDCEIIFTGGFADYYNIGYTNIEDIDIIIGKSNKMVHQIDSLKILKINKKLRHKQNKNILYRCKYGEYNLDIWVEQPFDLSATNNFTININNIDYTIFTHNHQARYNKLMNIKYVFKDQNLLKMKKQKVQDKIILYKQYFDSLLPPTTA